MFPPMICQKTFMQLSLEGLEGALEESLGVQPKSPPAEEMPNYPAKIGGPKQPFNHREYYQKNRHKWRGYYKSYWKKNREKVLKQRSAPEYRTRASEYMKQYRLDHAEEVKARMKKWYETHKHDAHHVELCRKASRKYYLNHLEQERKRGRLYDKNNRDKINARNRRLRRTDLNFAMKDRLRATMNRGLRRQWARKSRRTMELVGCSVEELKVHLEKQFKDGMSWENRRKWHVDHIRPLSSFDLTDPEQQKIAFNYMNLQPLWAHENHAKSDKFEAAKNPAAVSSLPGCGVGSGF